MVRRDGARWVGVIRGPWGLEQGLVPILQIWKLRPSESRLRNAWGDWLEKPEPASSGSWRAEHLSGLGDGHRGMDQGPLCVSRDGHSQHGNAWLLWWSWILTSARLREVG